MVINMKALKVENNIVVDAIIVDSLDGLGSEWVAAPSELHGIGSNINDTLTNPDQYQIDRASAYPSIQEQLDMQYWDSVNGTTTWADAIAKVKADYPKGGEA